LPGSIFVSNPIGREIARADETQQILYGNCDLSEIDFYRQRWPLLRDRRIETYTEIGPRFLT